jgi:transposase
VTVRDQNNQILFRQRLDHADRQKLRAELARWPKGTPVILEGTFGWGWMADELGEAGHEAHLASSRKVAAWREARGLAKSDRIDSDLLSELWPQNPRWWEVWLAPQEARDRREWLRYRMALVAMQTMTKNRIHATLHRHGILHDFSDLFGKKGREFLKLLAEADEPLRESARQTLQGYLQILERLRRQIAQVTRVVRKLVGSSGEAEVWRSLPGIGWVLAYTIHAEIGDIARFPNARKLCRYALLAPLSDESATEGDQGMPLGRHVGHAGRRTLKWALIEAAHGAVRKDPQFRAVYDRRTDSGKRDRNRGYIAVARELCRVGYSCVSKQRRYTHQRPARPGSTAEKNKGLTPADKPHPGLGQPDAPMVAAAG